MIYTRKLKESKNIPKTFTEWRSGPVQAFWLNPGTSFYKKFLTNVVNSPLDIGSGEFSEELQTLDVMSQISLLDDISVVVPLTGLSDRLPHQVNNRRRTTAADLMTRSIALVAHPSVHHALPLAQWPFNVHSQLTVSWLTSADLAAQNVQFPARTGDVDDVTQTKCWEKFNKVRFETINHYFIVIL